MQNINENKNSNKLNIVNLLSCIDDNILEDSCPISDSDRLHDTIEEKYMEKSVTRKFNWQILLGATAIVFILIFALVIGLQHLDMSTPEDESTSFKNVELKWWIENVDKSLYPMFGEDTKLDKEWNEMTLAQRYSEFTISDKMYHNVNQEIQLYFLDSTPMGSIIFDDKDMGGTTDGTKSADMYSIHNISSDLALAVNIGDSSLYNIYINTKYRPKTLGEFKEAIGYSDEHVYLDTRFFIYYYMDENKQTHQVLFDDVILWDATAKYLLSDDQLKLLYLVNIEEDLGRIVGELCLTSILGDDVGITIYDKGYFMFYYFGNEYLFKVEPSVITKYIEYIDNNSRGIRPNYISAKLDYTDKISYLPSVPWPVMQTSIDVIEDTHTEIVIPPWEDRAYNSRFDSIEYNNCTYTASNSSPMHTKSFYGEQLATLEITGYDPYNDKYYTTTVTIYEDGYNPLSSIPHIYTSNYALIVYFEEYDEAYYYYNESYIPNNLNEYDSNMGYLSAKEGIYKYIHDKNEYSILINDKFYNNSTAVLASYTFYILGIPGSQDINTEVIDDFSEAPVFTIYTTSVNNLIEEPITIYIYRSGYIQFSNLDSNIFFYVTEDRVTDLIGSVLDNYFAYIPSYLVE